MFILKTPVQEILQSTRDLSEKQRASCLSINERLKEIRETSKEEILVVYKRLSETQEQILTIYNFSRIRNEYFSFIYKTARKEMKFALIVNNIKRVL